MFEIKELKKALTLPDFDPVSAQNRMSPKPRTSVRPANAEGKPKTAAVMLIIYNKESTPNILLIKRQENLNYHPGQISFPGGTHEGTETFAETALRETHEEVGINPETLTVAGNLHPVYIPPSDFLVHPFAAWHDSRPVFTPCREEVSDIIEVKIIDLYDPDSRGSETRQNDGSEITVPYFKVNEHKVWGATAMILSEFLERLKSSE